MIRRRVGKLTGAKTSSRATPARARITKKKRSAPKRVGVARRAQPAATKTTARAHARAQAVRRAPAPKATQPPDVDPKNKIGEIVAFFRLPIVAVVKVTKGTIRMGDRIWIRGHTTNLKLTVTSMQIEHQPVTHIRPKDEAGIKIPGRARRGDLVYRLPS